MNAFGGATGQYGELKSISRGAVRADGVVMTNIHLVKQSGERVIVSREALAKDDKMAQVLQYACEALATSWIGP